MILTKKLTVMLTAFTVSTNLAMAQDVMPAEESFEAPKKEYSPFVDDQFPIRPLFGDCPSRLIILSSSSEILMMQTATMPA